MSRDRCRSLSRHKHTGSSPIRFPRVSPAVPVQFGLAQHERGVNITSTEGFTAEKQQCLWGAPPCWGVRGKHIPLCCQKEARPKKSADWQSLWKERRVKPTLYVPTCAGTVEQKQQIIRKASCHCKCIREKGTVGERGYRDMKGGGQDK